MRYNHIMNIVTLFIILGVIGTVTYVTVKKPFQKREGEITIGDLMEQSRSNLDHFLATGEKKESKRLGVVSPATYEGTLLISVSEEEQKRMRETRKEAPFEVYVPTKVPKGFTLWGNGSHGVENNVHKFQAFFRHSNGDLLQTYQYDLQKYLTQYKKTLQQFTSDKGWIIMGEKKIFVAESGAITAGKYKYTQGVTVITDTTLMRAEYAGVTKLSIEDLKIIGASFVK